MEPERKLESCEHHFVRRIVLHYPIPQQQQHEAQMAEMQAQQQQPAGPSLEEQLKAAAMERDEARKDAALQAEIERNNRKLQQEMALADAKAAANL